MTRSAWHRNREVGGHLDMRRPQHDGQKPRPLQENATSNELQRGERRRALIFHVWDEL